MPENVDELIRQQAGLPASPVSRPAAPAVPAAPNPVDQENALLKQKLAEQEQAMASMSARMDGLMGELVAKKAQEDQKALELPSEEALEGMSRVEAIQKVAEVVTQKQMNQLMGALRGMAEDVVANKNWVEEQELRKAFPNLDVDRYRPAVTAVKMRNPRMSAMDAIRLVADPRDLISEPLDKTPQPHDAFRMESGRPASRSAAAPPPSNGPSEAELKSAFAKARAEGNKMSAERYLLELLKGRPDVPSQGRTH